MASLEPTGQNRSTAEERMGMHTAIDASVKQAIERGALESKTAQEIVRWAVQQFGDRVALASSFGAEDMAIIHMLAQVTPKPRIFTLDTVRLNQETYDVMDKIREKYKVSDRKSTRLNSS